MSAADDVTSGPDAQRPGAGGAVGADAMTLERAKLAWPERGLIRDRENIDDVKVRPRIGFVVEEDRVGYEHSVVVNADQQMLSRTRCLEIVREARELVRKTAPPSPATVVDYTAKSDRLLAACEQLSGDESSRWNQLLQPYAPKKNSFFPMRAAVAWRMREQIRTLLAEQCRMQRGSVPAMGWHHALTEIEIRIARLLAIEGVQRSELLEASGVKSVRAKSKRKDLHRFPADWPEQMIETSEWGAYGAAVWVLANTGCRPEELVRGVELRPECNHITVRINGAKVGESSGQLWRELDVAWRSVP